MKILATLERQAAISCWFMFAWGVYFAKDQHGVWFAYTVFGSICALVVGSWYWNEAEECLKRDGKND